MVATFRSIHRCFKLNGFHFNNEELREVAYSLIKEGFPYEQLFGEFLMDWLDTKTYVEVKTSGTTGTPKIIQLQKQQMMNSALATGSFFGISAGDKTLHCLPSNFIAGKMMLVRALILGLELDLTAPTSNPLKNIEKDYDFCAMVPLQLQHSIAKLNKIKTLIVGGAPVSNVLIEEIQDSSTKIYATYGMTETITHIAAKQLNGFESSAVVKKTLFKALPDVSLSIDDRNCLVIDAPTVSEEVIKTNDLIRLTSENEFEWLGRYDHVINSGGIKLIPEQIEAKLRGLILNRFFVTGKKDKELGQKLILIVEGSTSLQKELSNLIKSIDTLDKFEIPKEIHFTDKFEETATGKILREATFSKVFK